MRSPAELGTERPLRTNDTFRNLSIIHAPHMLLSYYLRNPRGESHLRPKDFGKSASGQLVRSKLGHWTFVPNPLPPALEYAPPLVNRIVSAERALGELAGVGQPGPPHLIAW